jgi:hypothetical protein
MPNFLIYPNIDENNGFPSAVNQAIAESPELKAAFDLPSRLSPTELNATFVRFEDEAGNPLPSRSVVIKVSATTGEIIDIVSEA